MDTQSRTGKRSRKSNCSGRILRILRLPSEIEADKVTATLKNGVLELTLPKVAKAQPVRISSEGRLNCQSALAEDRIPGYRTFLRVRGERISHGAS